MSAGLAVVSRPVPAPTDLVALLPRDIPEHTMCWVRRGEGVVGHGIAWSGRTLGAARMEEADTAWRALGAASAVDDRVRVPGSGLVALGSFAFADESPAGGRLLVPRVLVGRRGETAWLTLARPVPEGTSPAEVLGELIDEVDDVDPAELVHRHLPAADPVSAPGVLTETDGELDSEAWGEAVRGAVARIDARELEKVVLSRDVRVRTRDPLDVRHLLARLADGYPATWTFSVDGLVGATPEMLVRRDHGLAAARVLAGTVPTAADGRDDLRVAEALATSSKDLAEHELAVDSLVSALGPYCASMNVPEQPFVLRLPNVMHLASDVTGAVRAVDGLAPSSLILAEALHPTAAVGGTPTAGAVALLAAIEGTDRGRYAGPVGWLGADGDGEWGIALRCGAVLDEHTIRLHAGCGIVAGSEPDAEYAESQAKLRPLRWALGDEPARRPAETATCADRAPRG